CTTIGSRVSQYSGAESTVSPSTCSENASVSRVESKMGNCHHAWVSGTCVAFQYMRPAVNTGSPLSGATVVHRPAITSRPMSADSPAYTNALTAHGIHDGTRTIPPPIDYVCVEHTDRRYTQTGEAYAANDLETMQEARRYAAHVFGLFRPFIGSRVLEVGSGIGTMTRPLADTADLVVGIEPN